MPVANYYEVYQIISIQPIFKCFRSPVFLLPVNLFSQLVSLVQKHQDSAFSQTLVETLKS